MAKISPSETYHSWNPFLRACLVLHKKNFMAVFGFSFLINMLMLTVPLYLLQIFNRVIPSKSIDTLIFLTGIVILAAITLTVLESSRNFIFMFIGSWLDKRVGGLVLSGSIIRSVRKCRKSSPQGLRELSAVRRLFSGSTLFAILDAPWTPIFLMVLFYLHPLIGTITLIGAMLLFALALINELSTRELMSQASIASSKSDHYAAAVLRNSDSIESMGMRSNVIAGWEKYHVDDVDLQTRTAIRTNRIAALAKFCRLMLQVSIVGTACVLVLQDKLSAGGLIASLLLMRRAVGPLEKAVMSWKVIVHAKESFNTVSGRMDQAAELKGPTLLPLPGGDLEVHKVIYTYPNHSKHVLKGISFTARRGEVIGLSGDTSTGKSTLSRLLVGLAEPEEGRVQLGGINISNWGSEELGPYIGYLSQSSELFSGSVRQNIARMGDGDFGAVQEAASLVGADAMINQLSEGYDTEIGEGGAYLSGGQCRKIALARAVYGNPLLIVLDEPDLSLDRKGRAALIQTIYELKRKGAIVVVISHHNSVLDTADHLLTLRKGMIDEVLKPTDRSDLNTRSASASSQVVKITSTQQVEE